MTATVLNLDDYRARRAMRVREEQNKRTREAIALADQILRKDQTT